MHGDSRTRPLQCADTTLSPASGSPDAWVGHGFAEHDPAGLDGLPAHAAVGSRSGPAGVLAQEGGRVTRQGPHGSLSKEIQTVPPAVPPGSAPRQCPPAGFEPATHSLGRFAAPPTVALTSLFWPHGVLLCRRWRRCCAVVHPPIHSPQLHESAGFSPVQSVLGGEHASIWGRSSVIVSHRTSRLMSK
jgi:hypothetical protein